MLRPVPDTASPPQQYFDPWRRTRLGLIAMALILAGGTIAYRALGLSWIDAYYQTVITVSTVGYTEVGTDIGPAYRLVSSFVILFGVGLALYTIGVTFDALMEGHLRAQFGRSRMERAMDELRDHIIVCGAGQVGLAIKDAVAQHGDVAVLIDSDPDRVAEIHGPVVVGDATDDDVLLQAGIRRARGLIVALDSDAANIYVTLSARELNPKVFVVARSNDTDAISKLTRAGADRVVNPHEIGGQRMASLVLQPHVADFLAESMSDQELQFRMNECPVAANSALVGRSLADIGVLETTGITLLAIRRPEGDSVHHPGGDYVLAPGDVMICLGTPEEQQALRTWLSSQETDGAR